MCLLNQVQSFFVSTYYLTGRPINGYCHSTLFHFHPQHYYRWKQKPQKGPLLHQPEYSKELLEALNSSFVLQAPTRASRCPGEPTMRSSAKSTHKAVVMCKWHPRALSPSSLFFRNIMKTDRGKKHHLTGETASEQEVICCARKNCHVNFKQK